MAGISETELKELVKEATKHHNLLSAGIVHIHALKDLLKKIIDMPEYKPKPKKKYSPSMECWIQKFDEESRLKGETYHEAVEIQKRLNLAHLPHYKRIFGYRRTGNLNVFDGLKKN